MESNSESEYNPESDESDSDSAYDTTLHVSDSEREEVSEAESDVIPLYRRNAACQAEFQAPESDKKLSPTAPNVELRNTESEDNENGAASQSETQESDEKVPSTASGVELIRNSTESEDKENGAACQSKTQESDEKVPSTASGVELIRNSTESADKENGAACQSKTQESDEKVPSTASGVELIRNSTESEDKKTEKSATITYKKPYRFCIFCNEYKSKLSAHIASQHKDNEQVQNALKLPKSERDNAFSSFRKQGIFEINKREARRDEPSYERERDGDSELIKCGVCSAFLSKKYIKRHEDFCKGKSEAATNPVSIPISLLNSEIVNDASYTREIVTKFRTSDDVGHLCVTDGTLQLIGQRLWAKHKGKMDKFREVRKSVMMNVRRLSGLYIQLKATQDTLGPLPQSDGGAIDLFKRANFRHLEEAVHEFTKKENGIKAGLKLSLYYLLKSASKILKGTFYIQDQDDLAEGIDKFVAVLEFNYHAVFGDASHALFKQREEKLRLPSNQPLEEDIKKLKDHTVKNISELSNDLNFIDEHVYAKLRDNVVTRLTLFTARRGGEPSRLFVKNWTDAESDIWLDKQLLDTLDPMDKKLANSLKIGYQGGKGLHLVPVLFPQDCHNALRKLSNEEARREANIPHGNMFCFPAFAQWTMYQDGMLCSEFAKMFQICQIHHP